MVELGLYAVLRLYSVIFLPALDDKVGLLRGILLTLGTLTALLGAIMCFAEHHLKRLLAFSTVSHSGLMLSAIALQGSVATAGFLTYLLAHAFVKSSLFFIAGILLHRLRTASEPALVGKATQLRGSAAMWFLGGVGLAGAPGFATVYGESLTSSAAEAIGVHWLSAVFIASGSITAAAVFRVGFHSFLGWGDEPITDRAALVDELPETPNQQRGTPWYLLTPPIICLACAITLSLIPGFREQMLIAASRVCSQPGYLHAVYTGSALDAHLVGSLVPSALVAGVRGVLAAVIGLALALTSVFRSRLARVLRLGAFLEGPMRPLRALQSGHVSDYVLWMTIGASCVTLAYMALLR
jgi:multicomponent Na+:H+ antiporter subunit D